MTKTKPFHIQESILTQNGFTKVVIDDKNGPNDTINTLRIEWYKKRIREDIIVEVNYCYLTEDEKQYKLHESSIELNINGEYAPLPITKLSDLLTLILILKGEN